jgi:hypothetical protein
LVVLIRWCWSRIIGRKQSGFDIFFERGRQHSGY